MSGSALAARWRAGELAFRRGLPPPGDPDESDGWYFAENLAARGDPLAPGEAVAIARGPRGVVRWAFPRVIAGTLAFAAVLLALALIPGAGA